MEVLRPNLRHEGAEEECRRSEAAKGQIEHTKSERSILCEIRHPYNPH